MAIAGHIFDCGTTLLAPKVCPCIYDQQSNVRGDAKVRGAALAALAGVSKVFLFPVGSAVGTAVLPLYVLGRGVAGLCTSGVDSEAHYKKAEEALASWSLCFGGLMLTATYVGLSAFSGMDLNTSIAIFLGAVVISVYVHADRARFHVPLPE